MGLGAKFKLSFDGTSVQRGLRSVKRGLSTVGDMVKRVALSAVAMGAALGGALALFAKSASAAASDFEMLVTQFEVLTGSQETASKLMKVFREEAQKSSLTLQDWAGSAKTLLAFGTDSKDVVGAMRLIGDVSMGSSEQFKFMTIAFAQVAAAGRLMGQEVRQMVNAGFNPLQQISERTGESMAVLKKRMEDGLIPFSEVKQAFIDATSEGGRFYKAIDRGADTFIGKTNKLKDAAFGIKLAFGEGFNDGLKVALDELTNFIPQFKERVTQMGGVIGMAIKEAVEGDANNLNLVGGIIGDYLMAGIEASMKRPLTKLYDWITPKTGGITPSSIAKGAVFDHYLRSDSFGETFKEATAGTRDKQASLASALRLQQAESYGIKSFGGRDFRMDLSGKSPIVDGSGNRIRETLESIERHMAKTEMNTRGPTGF